MMLTRSPIWRLLNLQVYFILFRSDTQTPGSVSWSDMDSFFPLFFLTKVDVSAWEGCGGGGKTMKSVGGVFT